MARLNKEDTKLYNRIYETSEKRKAYKKQYDFIRGLKRHYNITVEEYNALFNFQKGCCYTCKKHQSLFKIRLAVDHCHTTGKVRGLLCYKCNVNLGIYENNKIMFESYLKERG